MVLADEYHAELRLAVCAGSSGILIVEGVMKKVTVVGVGALGSHFVQFLRSEDVEFKLIDFDRVEQKNTLSQFHGKPGVGKLKVQGLQSTLSLLWGMKVEVNTNKLTEENAQQLLAGADLIVDCLDNAEARRIIQRYV